MAIEVRKGAREPDLRDSAEPTHTGTRSLFGARAASSEWPATPSRSARPSAFGLPRPSSRSMVPPAPEEARSGLPRPASEPASAPPQRAQASMTRALTGVVSTSPYRPPPIKTDIEQLLPISHSGRSLPRPPRLPTFETQAAAPLLGTRRFPWGSLTVFALLMAASATTLLQYADMRGLPPVAESTVGKQSAPAGEIPTIVVGRASEERREAIERIERTSAGDPVRVRQALLDEAERALAADDERLAEALFARVYELDRDSASAAYGLARVRLAQGNLEGAEGWVLAAIRTEPRSATYHALYASVLERWGRLHEAQLERAITRSLTRAQEP